MDRLKAFVIHLPRATKRRAQVDHILDTVPCDAEILDAVDGSALSGADQAAVFSETALHHPPYPFGLNAAEIGCFLSHRAAWQMIVDDKLDAGLVFEDDVQIDRGVFANALTLAQDHVADLGYIQFQVRDIKVASRILVDEDGVQILAPTPTPLRASAQLISAKAAAHLLDLTKRFDRPVDTFLQMHWVTDVPPAFVVPSGVSDRTAMTGGSNISKKVPLRQRVKREIQRALYRRAVRKASMR